MPRKAGRKKNPNIDLNVFFDRAFYAFTGIIDHMIFSGINIHFLQILTGESKKNYLTVYKRNIRLTIFFVNNFFLRCH